MQPENMGTVTSPNSGVVVICTKDRPHEFAMACRAAYGVSPQLPIVVVDATDGDDTRATCERLVSSQTPSVQIHYHRASAVGLARQRNQAIAICERMGVEFIHFIDDDTEVMDDYFGAIEARFR